MQPTPEPLCFFTLDWILVCFHITGKLRRFSLSNLRAREDGNDRIFQISRLTASLSLFIILANSVEGVRFIKCLLTAFCWVINPYNLITCVQNALHPINRWLLTSISRCICYSRTVLTWLRPDCQKHGSFTSCRYRVDRIKLVNKASWDLIQLLLLNLFGNRRAKGKSFTHFG